MTESSNFSFLKVHSAQLYRLATLAERYFGDDPGTSLIKIRQFGELLAQMTAAKASLFTSSEEAQADLLRRLKDERVVPYEINDLFHQIRIAGNKATHKHTGTHSEALSALKIARQLAIWFHRTFASNKNFVPTPFVPPETTTPVTVQVMEELKRLKQAVLESKTAAEQATLKAEEERKARLSAEEQAKIHATDRQVLEALVKEAETERKRLNDELAKIQAHSHAQALPVEEIVRHAEEAAKYVDIDEAATRMIIDQQLRQAKWDVDSENLTYAKGARPIKGRNIAIAEWPTESGPADYALFIGTQCFGVIEAKRKRKNVSAAIDQSERYSQGFKFVEGTQSVGTEYSGFRVPFLFAANGRPYLKQIETQSGIWFRDARLPTNQRRALADWYTPEGLKALMEVDKLAAEAHLKSQSFEYGFPLRPYQKKAIEKVEEGLTKDRDSMLLALATGTGKTLLSVAMLYRLISSKRFRRACFVVDRSALGKQAEGQFSTAPLVGLKPFSELFGVKGLDEVFPELNTRVHICTIQGLVKRVLYASNPDDVPPIDQYDLLVVDECHRGYLLDRELSDSELEFRNQEDYVSKYRRVIEHFDCTRIGLTATPALHTIDIFGDPIFTYSYREAVVDGFLVDHEPPIRIETALAQSGIVFKKNEDVQAVDTKTGQVDLFKAPDEIRFDVEDFNKKVITVDFNRVVAEELVKHIDPNLPGKTLIFAVSDAHADIVVNEIKKAFSKVYGPVDDSTVRKITGSVDKVGQLILRYRNEEMPKIAVTVDLLTTGIDVPKITNLVFLRRVNSRILYEQMIGRATRLCDDIGKEAFRIFDAVDLYSHLQNLTQMKPVVVNPSVSLSQLIEEFGRMTEEAHRSVIRDQILVKLRRKLKKMPDDVRERYEAEIGERPEGTLDRLRGGNVNDLADWVRGKPRLGPLLDWGDESGGGTFVPISPHKDAVIGVTRGYGKSEKPEDFLESFTIYVRSNLNKIAALTVVVQRPRELTRAQLRDLRLELDKQGYSETNIRRAWLDTKNEEIAASIIGFIRKAAISDEALVPYEERVQKAIKGILARGIWTDVQRQWLTRIGTQIEKTVVVDRNSFDEAPFDADGGFNRLNRVFDGRLEVILGDINEEIWKKAG